MTTGCNDKPCFFPARSRNSQSPGGQPPSLGLPASGGPAGGRDLRREELDGLLRGVAARQLQHLRELRRIGPDGPQAERHGTAVEVEQR